MHRSIFIVAVIFVLTMLQVSQVSAATSLAQRSIKIRSSAVSATNIIHDFKFDIGDSSDIGSISFEYCSNSPLFSKPCTPPSGFNILGAAIDSETGETGFTVDPSSTTNKLILSRTPSTPTLGTASYGFDGITNPNYLGTFYVRIATFTSTDATGSPIETGGVAASTANQIGVNAEVPPFLLFCVAQSILFQDCSTATGNHISMGTFSDSQVSFGNAQMFAATNAEFGYAIVYYGTSLTSGTNKIDGMNTKGPSVPGSAQFGMNLVSNTNPSAGIDPTGPGSATGTTDYNTLNEFKFLSGDPLVVSAGPNDRRTFTGTYIANIPTSQPPGVYTTTLTYICTALF